LTRLIVYSLDRLSRRLIHLHTLLDLFGRHGLELLVITDPHFGNSAANRLMTNIVASASEFQQALNRERMADRRAALKQRGKRVAGRIPFGYQADPVTKTLTPHPDQSVIVRDFFELASQRRTTERPGKSGKPQRVEEPQRRDGEMDATLDHPTAEEPNLPR
jgi:DNA invertase Pin-like site-specific DNA recombinase